VAVEETGRRVVVDTLASLFFTVVAPVWGFTFRVVAVVAAGVRAVVPFGLGVVAAVFFFWAAAVVTAAGRFVVVVVVCCFLTVVAAVGFRVVVTTNFLVVD